MLHLFTKTKIFIERIHQIFNTRKSFSTQAYLAKKMTSNGSKLPLEDAKRNAAYKAIDELDIKPNFVIGIGSGSTIVYAVERLAKKVASEKIPVVCVPTSFQSKQLIIQNKLVLGDLETYPELCCAIDGADEVDKNLNLIKGGGGCHLQEKIIASCAKELIIIADHTKNSAKLGQQYKKGIPIEVVPMAHIPVQRQIESRFGGVAKLRLAVSKAGPVVTDSGNFILDWCFPDGIEDWTAINQELIAIPGVVETGLFINMTKKALFGMPDGTVIERC